VSSIVLITAMGNDYHKVSDLGEDALISRIAGRIGRAPRGELWSGDDAAVVTAPGPRLLLTTDVMTEGVDFDLAYASGHDIGWKSVAVNVSDVAAMGGRPTRAVATLALRLDVRLAFVDALVDGMLQAAERWGLSVVGGDISRASEIFVGIALVGEPGEPTVTRAGARRGDAICVTGALGGAAGGLIALRRGMAGPGPTEGHSFSRALSDALGRLAARQLRPNARLDEGRVIAAAGATAMMDVSDGLVLDLHRLLEASDAGCAVSPEAVPVDADLELLAGAVTDVELGPATLALTGGEDFELLFTIGRNRLDAAKSSLAELGCEMSVLGDVTDGARWMGERDLGEWKEAGWDHLRGR
jgi:thiamine-monophosphate kinase